MLKVMTTDGESGRKTLFLGLTRKNLDELPKNRPIVVSVEEVGGHADRIVILGGETQEDLLEDLRSIGVPIPADAKGIVE